MYHYRNVNCATLQVLGYYRVNAVGFTHAHLVNITRKGQEKDLTHKEVTENKKQTRTLQAN